MYGRERWRAVATTTAAKTSRWGCFAAEGGVAQSYRGREGNDESGLRRDRADLLPLNERRGRRIRTYFRDQLDSRVANVDLLRCWKLPCCLQPKDTNWLFDA